MGSTSGVIGISRVSGSRYNTGERQKTYDFSDGIETRFLEQGQVSASLSQGGGQLTLSGLGLDQQVFDCGLQFIDGCVVGGSLTRQVAL